MSFGPPRPVFHVLWTPFQGPLCMSFGALGPSVLWGLPRPVFHVLWTPFQGPLCMSFGAFCPLGPYRPLDLLFSGILEILDVFPAFWFGEPKLRSNRVL